ncbi:DUF2264 domain-containing protein [Lachnotalea glycerini]|uniref:DUF2264 domain-containing protein n=1 Tax=Lachnotalea glycerini TaxID=1763509 RepID=A0A371J7J3_9FIRM|nr:DUF2264 domain-containing protein [Lachnotalea glycerini]RDY28637.1 DUF2264 domain-containing protein [Lachnotalea glycerini]
MYNTKKDLQELLSKILNPLKPFYSEERARLKIGYTSSHYPDESAWMEGFSRPLWGLVPYWAGGGEDKEFAEIYRKGLAAGTNPNSKEYWGKCYDFDQRLVEMAAISYGILMAPEKVWDPLSEEEKENLTEWLNEINRNQCCKCNWQFFNILVNIALKSKGRTYSEEKMESALAFIESCYLGDGWYVDGELGQADYYIPFAMHFYGMVYAKFMQKEDPIRSKKFIERAERFGKDFIYWFDDDGSALPYGRSLTYKFAQVSFFSICVAVGIEPVPLGVMKGIIMRHLQYWMNAPIFDHTGLLTIGYHYPNLQMSENYNAPGSPYWSMKTFAFLSLPDEHPFWSVESLPMPKLEEQKYIKHGDMIVQRKDGHVYAMPGGRLFLHGFAHTEEKYAKFIYSTKYGFSIARSQKTLEESAPDSVLSFEVFGHVFVRGQSKNYEVTSEGIYSDWSPIEGIDVHSEIIPTKLGHKRIHTIHSAYDCIAHDAGFAVSIGEEKECIVKCTQGNGKLEVLKPDPNTNLLITKTMIPMMTYKIQKGKNIICTEFEY